MYMLVLVACMTFSGETHCQRFERDHSFVSEARCEFAAAIERGQYADKIRRRDWIEYNWDCETTLYT